MSPASALTPPSLFVTARSGAVPLAIGVVSLALLLARLGSAPLTPLSETVATLTIPLTPAATGRSTSTAKAIPDTAAPGAKDSKLSRHSDPGVVPLQFHRGSLVRALNCVCSGTSSITATPSAVWLPTFETPRP